MEGGDNVGGANSDVGGGASSGAAADPSAPSDGAVAAAGGGVVDNSSPVMEDGNCLTATTQTVHSENGTPVCEHLMSWVSTSGTTGMRQHYGKKHPALYAQIMKKHTTPANAKANVSAAIGELIVVYCLLVL